MNPIEGEFRPEAAAGFIIHGCKTKFNWLLNDIFSNANAEWISFSYFSFVFIFNHFKRGGNHCQPLPILCTKLTGC